MRGHVRPRGAPEGGLPACLGFSPMVPGRAGPVAFRSSRERRFLGANGEDDVKTGSRWTRTLALTSALGLLAACGSGGDPEPGPPPPGDGTATLGPSGGTVTLSGGPSLTVPPGALTASTTLTISSKGSNGPSGNPVYVFGPAGTTFASPVTVSLPRPASLAVGAAAAVYWTLPASSTQYEPLAATVVAGGVLADVTHFSEGFVGEPCAAGATCTAGLGACDVGALACEAGAPVCTRTGSAADGTACAAAPDACAAESTCQGGVCQAGGALSCDDADPCTIDSCDLASGCVFTPNLCDDGVFCTADVCDPGGCTHSPNSIACYDGNECTQDLCDVSLDCLYPPVADGTPCTGGTCTAGVCG